MSLAALVTSIPSPAEDTWYVGPFPIRAYAMAILAGIAVAVWLTTKRWAARGNNPDDVLEIAFWAVPFGIVGGRIYHVITTPEPYWGPDGDPWKALRIWDGGLGIWGAVALGAVGAYIGCRRLNVSFVEFADALAPGLLIAQGIGRLGNWFNQELFGAPTTLPWGLEVDTDVAARTCAEWGIECAPGTLFHPTFLYEMIWNIAGAFLLMYLAKRFKLGHGQVFWLYAMIYTSGRVWIEMLRIDTAEVIFGLRLNVWTSIVVFAIALVAFVIVARRYPAGDEPAVSRTPDAPEGEADDEEQPDQGS
ncbi:prolipoprotein diacylglyceryl transferase [Paraoerskovia marina]|uniref:Phosphatidylglycerol--prolipoprotein diacylglyceryl transferase n=1 Tax=Paraoerskovia marina TaxID=545619 RepID=A0A1H1T6U8_9CELL|nr:prolipoprotein diacylglyceryl transferase [Paraoerskovia marina]SDS55982.1 prolipoprotein diacylglyceryl transferase [Paraoerskovia marina]